MPVGVRKTFPGDSHSTDAREDVAHGHVLPAAPHSLSRLLLYATPPPALLFFLLSIQTLSLFSLFVAQKVKVNRVGERWIDVLFPRPPNAWAVKWTPDWAPVDSACWLYNYVLHPPSSAHKSMPWHFLHFDFDWHRNALFLPKSCNCAMISWKKVCATLVHGWSSPDSDALLCEHFAKT